MALRREPCAVALGVVAVLTLCHVPTPLLAFSPIGPVVTRHAAGRGDHRRAALAPSRVVARRASSDDDLDFLRDFDALAEAGAPPAPAPKGPSVFELERQKEAAAKKKKPTSKRAALRAALRGIVDTLLMRTPAPAPKTEAPAGKTAEMLAQEVRWLETDTADAEAENDFDAMSRCNKRRTALKVHETVHHCGGCARAYDEFGVRTTRARARAQDRGTMTVHHYEGRLATRRPKRPEPHVSRGARPRRATTSRRCGCGVFVL